MSPVETPERIAAATPAATRRPAVRTRLSVAAAALAAVLAAAFGTTVVPLLAAWLLTSLVVPGATWLRRVVLAVPVATGAFAAVFTVFAMLHATPDLVWVPATVAVIAAGAAAARPSAPRPAADRIDGASLGSAVAVAAAVAHNAIGWGAGGDLARISTTTDGIRHIALGADVLAHHGYVTFAPSPALLGGLSHYPQGAAGLLALILQTIGGDRPTASSLAVVGYWTAVAVLALTAWLSTAAALVIARHRSAAVGKAPALFAAGVVTAVYAVGPGFLAFAFGYFAQSVATLALAGLLLVLAHRPPTRRTVAASAALLVTVAQCWYLIVPVVLVLLAWSWRAARPRWPAVAAAAVAAPFVAFPVVEGPSPTAQLLVFGGTQTPDRLAVAGVVIATAAAVIVLRICGRRGGTGPLEVALYALGAMTLATAAYQMSQGGLGYYTEKLFVLALLAGGLVAAAGVVGSWRTGDARARLLVATATAGMMLMTGAGWSTFAQNTGDPAERTSAEAAAYLAEHPYGLPRGSAAFAVDGCSRQDKLLSQTIANLARQWTPSFGRAEARYLWNSVGDIKPLIAFAQDPSVRHVDIYSSRPCPAAHLDELRRVPTVRIVTVP